MIKLLLKEMKLTASPLSYIFIAFGLMTLIPGYPILCGAFFSCLGIFYTFNQAREFEDITYTVLLPVKKSDVVKAKFSFVIMIQMLCFTLCVLLTILRMTVLKNGAPYVSNPLMNANGMYLGFVLLIYAAYNVFFVGGFFKTAYKLTIPFVTFCVVGFLFIGIAEALHYFPGMAYLNATSGINTVRLVILAIGIIVYIIATTIAIIQAKKHFEMIDL